MQKTFVRTDNVRKLLTAFSELERRGADEARFMVVEGAPGLGKSHALHWLSTHNDMVFLRAKKSWSPNWMLLDLAEALGLDEPGYTVVQKFNALLPLLKGRVKAAQVESATFTLIIDEADYLSGNDRLLSTLRDLADLSSVVIILVGMGKIRLSLKRFPQMLSRMGQYVAFKPLNKADVGRFAETFSPVTLDEKVIALLHLYTRGYIREIKEALAAITRVAARTGLTHIGVDELSGHVLLRDRLTGKAIILKGDGEMSHAA